MPEYEMTLTKEILQAELAAAKELKALKDKKLRDRKEAEDIRISSDIVADILKNSFTEKEILACIKRTGYLYLRSKLYSTPYCDRKFNPRTVLRLLREHFPESEGFRLDFEGWEKEYRETPNEYCTYYILKYREDKQ